MKPRVYYNDNSKDCCAWLRELMKAGLIAEGEIDSRSITDVRPDDLKRFTRAHFFAGVAGWEYALQLARWPDDRPVWTGSVPCQPFTNAGNGKGTKDSRDLWPVFARLISKLHPPVVFGEQSHTAIAHGWLDRLCDDLEESNYAIGSAVLPTCSVGSKHERSRLWWVADSRGDRHAGAPVNKSNPNQQWNLATPKQEGNTILRPARAGVQFSWPPGPRRVGEIPRMDDGLSARMVHGRDFRIKGYGNAIVPQVAAEFISAYLECTTVSNERTT